MEENKVKVSIRDRIQAVPVSERYWWKVVALSFFGWVLMYADRTILNPLQPTLGAEFGLTNAELGLLNSVFFFAYAATQIPFGILGDKVGRRLTICIGFLIFGMATLFSGFATGLFLLVSMRIMAGIGEGTYYGPQYSLAADAIPTSKITLGLAIINSGMAFGTSGGYLLSSTMVLGNGAHWSSPFLVMCIPTVIIGILFMVLLKEKIIRPEDQGKDSNAVATIVEAPKQKTSLASISKNRNLVCAFILCFCSVYANFVIITWLPQFLQVERGFAGSSVGFISSLVPWASIPGALIFARLSDKFKRTKLFVSILVPLAALSVFGIAFVTDSNLLIVVLICYGLTGKLALDPIVVSFVTKNAPKQSLGTILSTYNFIGMSGSILAPYITGALSDVTGSMQIGFYLASGMLLIGLFVFSFARDKEVKELV